MLIKYYLALLALVSSEEFFTITESFLVLWLANFYDQ